MVSLSPASSSSRRRPSATRTKTPRRVGSGQALSGTRLAERRAWLQRDGPGRFARPNRPNIDLLRGRAVLRAPVDLGKQGAPPSGGPTGGSNGDAAGMQRGWPRHALTSFGETHVLVQCRPRPLSVGPRPRPAARPRLAKQPGCLSPLLRQILEPARISGSVPAVWFPGFSLNPLFCSTSGSPSHNRHE